jgi:hypothetical protein
MKEGYLPIKELSSASNEIVRKSFYNPETTYCTTVVPTVDSLKLGEDRIYFDGTDYWRYTKVAKQELRRRKLFLVDEPDENISVGVRAYLNGTQLNSPTGAVKILLNATTYDIGSNFDISAYKFTAPFAGYYSISACIYFYNCSASYWYLTSLYKNGVAFNNVNVGVPGSSLSMSSPANDIIHLAQGDYLELYALTNDTRGTYDIQGGGAYPTYLSIFLIQKD